MYIKSLFICVHIGLSMIGGFAGMVVGALIAFILFLIGVPSSYTNPIGLTLEAVLGIAFFIGTFLLLSPFTKKLIELFDRHGWTG
jgi:hypothetical protein|nr:hypothetical protein [uncultured Dialister sp.]